MFIVLENGNLKVVGSLNEGENTLPLIKVKSNKQHNIFMVNVEVKNLKVEKINVLTKIDESNYLYNIYLNMIKLI